MATCRCGMCFVDADDIGLCGECMEKLEHFGDDLIPIYNKLGEVIQEMEKAGYLKPEMAGKWMSLSCQFKWQPGFADVKLDSMALKREEWDSHFEKGTVGPWAGKYVKRPWWKRWFR